MVEGSAEVVEAFEEMLHGHAASTTNDIPVAMHKDDDLKLATIIFWQV